MKYLVFILLLIAAPLPFFAQDDSLWAAADVPPKPYFTDGPVEVGTIFKYADTGMIYCVRYFVTRPGDQYLISVWDKNRNKIVTQVFTGLAGWNRVLLRNAVAISPNTEYMVSVFCPVGYGSKPNVFTAPVTKGLLTGISGKYIYGSAGGYPLTPYKNSSYTIQPVVSKVVPQNSLIVNAGMDTLITAQRDSSYVTYTIPGIVTGDGVTFIWSTDSAFIDTTFYRQQRMTAANTTTPTIIDMKIGVHKFTLTATDKYGFTSKDDIYIIISRHPQSTVIRLLENGKWYFEGSKYEGFLEPDDH